MRNLPVIVVQLIHIQGPLKGQIQEFVEDRIAIGRHPTCQLRFPADLAVISRKHAEIVQEGNLYKLVDHSTNGTFVNGKSAPGADPETIKRLARVALVEDVKGDTPERGLHIDQGEISALLNACTTDRKKPTAGARDAALIALAYQTGARREEIARIELSDLTPNDEGLDVVIRHGKGNKARTVFIYNGTLSFLNDWLDLRGSDTGRLFCPVNKSGKIDPRGTMTGEALRQMLEKRSAQAGLAEAITWHDFRRTFAGNLWDSGADGVTIQKLMGHASQNQTAKYDRTSSGL